MEARADPELRSLLPQLRLEELLGSELGLGLGLVLGLGPGSWLESWLGVGLGVRAAPTPNL